MVMAFSLRARFVFPVDLPPIEDGVVVVEGERIVSVGRTAEGGVIDLGDVALFPAFVNAHTHLEFSDLQRPLGPPGMRLVDWIRLVIAEKKRHQNGPAPVVESGIKESLSFGVTTIGDIATCDVAAHLLPECDLTSFVEVIGFSRARASSIIGGVVARLVPQNWTEWEFKRPIARIHAGLSPHAPYTVSLHLLRVLIGLARDDNIPLAMHLAESREELHFLTDGTGPFRELLEERSMWDETAVPRGSRPLDYLRMLAESPRTLVIHGNYLNYEELRFLGANRDRMSLVYCPRTHSY